MFGVIFIFCYVLVVHGTPIDDKLDFGGDRTHARSIIASNPHVSYHVKTGRASQLTETDKKLNDSGVACSSTGCNVTKVTSLKESGDIDADIIVRVETKINVNKNDTKKHDVPDIPVVIGYAGTDDNNYNTQPKFKPNVNNGFHPMIPNYASVYPAMVVKQYNSGSSISRSYQKGYGYGHHNNVAPLPIPRQYVNYQSVDPPRQYGYVNYRQTQTVGMIPMNVRVKTLPPVTVDVTGNTIIPHMRPDSVYYHEQQSPTAFYAPAGGYNSMQFKGTKGTWVPSLPVPNMSTTPYGTYVGTRAGSSRAAWSGDRGDQKVAGIDDKLDFTDS